MQVRTLTFKEVIMKDIKPALFVNDPNKAVVKKDLHQESTLAKTKATTEKASTAANAGNTTTGEVGSSSVFSEENADKAKSFISNNKDDVKDLSKIVTKTSKAKTDVDKVKGVNKAIDSVEASMGGTGALSDLSPEQKSMLATASATASDTGEDLLILNGIRTAVNKGEGSSVASLTSTLNKLSGDSSFSLFDIGSELAFIAMVTAQAMEWGLPELIDSAIARMKDEKEREKQELEALIKASKSGSVDQTNYWMGKVGRNKARNIAELLISNILQFYKPVKDETKQTGGSKLLTLLDLLNAAWDSGRTLEPYLNANNKALEVLVYTSRGKYAALQLQLKFKEDTCKAIIKSTFPDLEPANAAF